MKFADKRISILLILAAFSFLVLYRNVLWKLFRDWSIDENYSHGFLVIPFALYFAWERRKRFAMAPRQASVLGLIAAVGGIAMLWAGILGAEVFTTEVSMLATLAGSIVFLFGWSHLRVMLFPLAFLLLMIPLPAIIFNQITFPLQLVASEFGESALIAARIPVLREGNIIHLANTSLAVAEACSGIRSLISLLTLGIIYGYFMDSRAYVRLILAFATIPVAIVTNGVRVAGTGVGAHYFSAAVAEGFFHKFSGWLVFVSAFTLLFLLHRGLVWKFPNTLMEDATATASTAAASTEPTKKWQLES
jgi:exosortase